MTERDDKPPQVREPSPDDPDYYHVEGEAVADEDDLGDFEWPEYIGETRERKRGVALLMTLLAPGLGYAYMGRFLSAMLVNLIFPTALFMLVVAWTLLKFFPLLPLAVVAVCWLVLHGLIVHDVLGLVRRERPFVLRPTNHVVVYASVFVFTFAVPLFGVVHWSLNYVWQRTWAGSDSMFPTVARGDLVLVDRTAYTYRAPARGDLVLVEEPGDSGVYFARVIGIGEDRVHMEGALPWVNGHELGQLRHAHVDDMPGHPRLPATLHSRSLWAYVETPHGIPLEEGVEDEPERWYMIARPARPTIEPTVPVELSENQLFVLSDNRGVPFGRPDDRIGGRVIERDWISGRPIFVLFSVSPDESEVRWDRVGLRLR